METIKFLALTLQVISVLNLVVLLLCAYEIIDKKLWFDEHCWKPLQDKCDKMIEEYTSNKINGNYSKINITGGFTLPKN